MFAPPSVANAKTAQALQAVVSPHLSMRDQSQPSSSTVSTPGSDGGLLRKKSEPVLSKSAPSSTPDFIALDREKKAMSSSPATPVLDEAPSLQIQEPNGTTVDGIPPETQEAPKENLLSAARSDSSQESVARSSVTSIQSSKVSVSRTGSSAATTPSTDLARKKTKKNRKTAWYNVLISPTYKSKCDDFRRIFKDVPESEMLIVDYSCALQREILAHGRLYVTQNYLCFYANIFRWETTVVIKCKDITSMTKEKTALVIPNAIQCSTEAGDRYFFTSFAARDKSYLMLFRLWQNSLIEQPMSIAECWRWIHCSYGDELGLSSDDEDYIAPDDLANCRSMDIRSLTEAPVEEAEIARPASASDISSPVPRIKNSVIPANSPDQDLKSSSSDEPDIEDEGCPNRHEMRKYLDRTFALDIDHTFTCLFTASEFYQELSSRKKISNIVFGNWEPSESEDVKQERVLSYNVNINHAMAKSCLTTEKQNLHRRSKPGKLYSVDCEFSNSGVPYADTFVVHQHLCIEKEGENRCRLRLFSDIDFRKPVWMLKGFIERNTVQGTLDSASALQQALDEEARRLAEERGQAVPALPGVDDAVANPGTSSATTEQSDGVIPASCATHRNLIIFLSIAIGILLVLNIYFMRKTFSNEINEEDFEVEHDVPNTVAGWKSAYFKSQAQHRRQLQDLQRLVDRSLQGLENMKVVFSRVKDVIAEKVAAIPPNSKSEL